MRGPLIRLLEYRRCRLDDLMIPFAKVSFSCLISPPMLRKSAALLPCCLNTFLKQGLLLASRLWLIWLALGRFKE